MERAELTAELGYGSEAEVCRIVAKLPNGSYAVLFVSVESTEQGAIVWELESVAKNGEGNPITRITAPVRPAKK